MNDKGSVQYNHTRKLRVTYAQISNFRDLGGYKTKDGRRVKWNIFYRSGELASLTTEDVGYLKSLGIKTIFEVESEGIRRQSSGLRNTNYI